MSDDDDDIDIDISNVLTGSSADLPPIRLLVSVSVSSANNKYDRSLSAQPDFKLLSPSSPLLSSPLLSLSSTYNRSNYPSRFFFLFPCLLFLIHPLRFQLHLTVAATTDTFRIVRLTFSCQFNGHLCPHPVAQMDINSLLSPQESATQSRQSTATQAPPSVVSPTPTPNVSSHKTIRRTRSGSARQGMTSSPLAQHVFASSRLPDQSPPTMTRQTGPTELEAAGPRR